MRKNKLTRPFLKWAGGKRQLLPELKKHLPSSFNTYYEPFVGAGALLFHLQPPKAVINDINEQLINCYLIIMSHLDELMADLKKHVNSEAYYYQMRDLDRKSTFSQMSPVEKASRLIYLNKTCYNGLFRVNNQGQFNVPFGSYQNPKIVDAAVLTAVNAYLTHNAVNILNTDFEEATAGAQEGDFVYLDPPYDPVSDTSSFTGYSTGGFGKEEQKRLKLVFDNLTGRGCKVMLSNSATKFILDLYGAYKDTTVLVTANRAINSIATARGKIDEVLIMNYATGDGADDDFIDDVADTNRTDKVEPHLMILRDGINRILEDSGYNLENLKDLDDKKLRNELIREIKKATGASVRELSSYMGISKDIIFRA